MFIDVAHLVSPDQYCDSGQISKITRRCLFVGRSTTSYDREKPTTANGEWHRHEQDDARAKCERSSHFHGMFAIRTSIGCTGKTQGQTDCQQQNQRTSKSD